MRVMRVIDKKLDDRRKKLTGRFLCGEPTRQVRLRFVLRKFTARWSYEQHWIRRCRMQIIHLIFASTLKGRCID